MSVTPSETPIVKCHCGFEATGFDEESTTELFQSHYCPRPPGAPARWHESFFSGTTAIVLIVAIVVAGIILEHMVTGK